MHGQGFTGEPGGHAAKASQRNQLHLTLKWCVLCPFLIQSLSKESFPLNSASSKQAKISSQKEQTGYCLLLIHLITRAAPEPLDSPSLLTQNNDGEQEARGTGKRRRKTSYAEKSQGFSLPLPPLVSKKALSCETRKEVFAG